LYVKENAANDPLLLEECLFKLLVHLFQQDMNVRNKMQQLPVMKSSTRHELLQRLLLATDYIFSFYDQSLSLEELAQVSCLSKFHFLRLFKLVFNKTPHQFINEVRIDRAKTLLRATALEVNEIALQTGFENASSFSRMFFQKTRIYPTQYR
jgi:AraC family transcriptional regulator